MSKLLPGWSLPTAAAILNLAHCWGLVQCSMWMQRLTQPSGSSHKNCAFSFSSVRTCLYLKYFCKSSGRKSANYKSFYLFSKVSVKVKFSKQHVLPEGIRWWRVIWGHHIVGFKPLFSSSIWTTLVFLPIWFITVSSWSSWIIRKCSGI